METFRRLLSYTWPYRRQLVGAVLCMMVVSGTVSALGPLLADTFDKVLGQDGETGKLSLIAWIQRREGLEGLKSLSGTSPALFVAASILLLSLVKATFTYFANYLSRSVGLSVVKDLRNDLFEAIHRQSLRFFGEIPTGTLMARILSDVERIQASISEKLGDILQEFLTLIALVTMMLALNWRLTLGSFLVVPIVALPIVRFGSKIRRMSRRSQEQTGDLAALLYESLYGVRIVKAFGMEPFEIARFREANARLLGTNLRAARTDVMTGPVIEVVGSAAAGVLIVLASGWIRSGVLTMGDLTAFMFLLYRTYLPLKKLSSANNVIQGAVAAGNRVFEIVDSKSDVVELPGAASLPRLASSIEFEDVSFAYSTDRPVLSGVNLTVKAGEVIAVVGRTGEGKTTLLNLVPRFYDPTAGRILVDGRDLRDVTVASLREQIGIVTQETILFNDTVRNNIAYGRPETPQERVEAAARAAFAHDFIVELPGSYETVIGEKGARLSGGERQRIAIARALLKDPPILILDEATSALDAEAERVVKRALSNLMSGRTVFMIAHRLQTVRSADRIVVIDDRRVREVGSHDELLALDGIYARLHRMQFEEVEATA